MLDPPRAAAVCRGLVCACGSPATTPTTHLALPFCPPLTGTSHLSPARRSVLRWRPALGPSPAPHPPRVGPAMSIPTPSPIGLLLRRLRTAAALSQKELAERAGLSVRAVSDLERGVHQVP